MQNSDDQGMIERSEREFHVKIQNKIKCRSAEKLNYLIQFAILSGPLVSHIQGTLKP